MRVCPFGTAGKPLEETAPGSAPGWWIAQKSSTTNHRPFFIHQAIVDLEVRHAAESEGEAEARG